MTKPITIKLSTALRLPIAVLIQPRRKAFPQFLQTHKLLLRRHIARFRLLFPVESFDCLVHKSVDVLAHLSPNLLSSNIQPRLHSEVVVAQIVHQLGCAGAQADSSCNPLELVVSHLKKQVGELSELFHLKDTVFFN